MITPRFAAPSGWRRRLRAHRIRKWEAHDLRRATPVSRGLRWWSAVAIIGRGLIATGLLLFGFVAYQLWGTGIETARAQRALSAEFDQLLLSGDTGTAPSAPDPTTPTGADDATDDEISEGTEDQGGAEPNRTPVLRSLGEPVARLEIPSIDVDDIVVVGVGSEELQLGPGHFPDTVPPGHLGNSAIAGHRTTYGQPFRNVDRLQPGDEIRTTTPEGVFTYRVTETRIVSPSDYFVVFTTNPDEAQLTLVSCHPVWSTAQRIIVSASLVPEESSPPQSPLRYEVVEAAATEPAFEVETPEASMTETPASATDSTADSTTDSTAGNAAGDAAGEQVPAEQTPVTSTAGQSTAGDPTANDSTANDSTAGRAGAAPEEQITDAFADGWFHDSDAIPQIALWGSLLILISLLAYRISVAVRSDLAGFALGVLPFVLALYYFFQNVNRLVPPGL